MCISIICWCVFYFAQPIFLNLCAFFHPFIRHCRLCCSISIQFAQVSFDFVWMQFFNPNPDLFLCIPSSFSAYFSSVYSLTYILFFVFLGILLQTHVQNMHAKIFCKIHTWRRTKNTQRKKCRDTCDSLMTWSTIIWQSSASLVRTVN